MSDSHAVGVMPVAVSTALRELWFGPRCHATVIGHSNVAVYLAVDDDSRIWSVVARDAVHQPGSVVLPVAASTAPFASWTVGETAEVGHNGAAIGATQLRRGRWWQATPHIGVAAHERCVTRLSALGAALPCGPYDVTELLDDMLLALNANQLDDAVASARALLGRGPGATPYGDDVLAGLLAAMALFARTTGSVGTQRHITDMFTQQVVLDAAEATTAISASLLDHASRGAVAAPVGRLLTALASGCDSAKPVADVLEIGATSGLGLLHGLASVAGLSASVARLSASLERFAPTQAEVASGGSG